MSNSTSIPLMADGELDELRSIQTAVQIDYASAVLLLFEYMLTFSSEYQHIWRTKKTLVIYLFFGMRYGAMLERLMACFSDSVRASDKGCIVIASCFNIFTEISKTSNCAIFTLRSYAIWNRSLLVLGTLALLTCGRLAAAVGFYLNEPAFAVTDLSRMFTTCNETALRLSHPFYTSVSALSLAFDFTVLLLTLVKTGSQVWSCRRLGLGKGISYYFVRDGIFYFLTIALWNAAAIAVINAPIKVTVVPGIINAFQKVISIIMAQRLMLNLREFEVEIYSPTNPGTRAIQVDFTQGSILGNVGAPLRMDDRDLAGVAKPRDVINRVVLEAAVIGDECELGELVVSEVARRS